MQVQAVVRREDALWALASLCALFRIRFDPALLTQLYPAPYRVQIFHEAARALGIETYRCALVKADWRKISLPIVAFETLPGSSSSFPVTEPAERRRKPRAQRTGPPLPALVLPRPEALSALLIGQVSDDCLRYFRCGSPALETMSIAEATARLAGELILAGKVTEAGRGLEGGLGAPNPQDTRRSSRSPQRDGHDRRQPCADRRTVRDRRANPRTPAPGARLVRRTADALAHLAFIGVYSGTL